MKKLLPHHLQELRDSGLNDDTIGARGYYSAESIEELKREGFSMRQVSPPALVLPMFDHEGMKCGVQVKPDQPKVFESNGKQKPRKYETAKGAKNVLDFPPLAMLKIMEGTSPIIVTEGIKKVDAIAQSGFAAIGLTGVWNYRAKKDGVSKPVDTFSKIPLQDRKVIVLFDSDGASNESVKLAGLRLVELLNGLGAKAELRFVPALPNLKKTGADDFLNAGHTVEEMLNSSQVCSEQQTYHKDGNLKLIMDQIHLNGGEFWKSTEGMSFASFFESNRLINAPVKSQEFEKFCRHKLYAAKKHSLSKQKVDELIDMICSEIAYSEQYPTYSLERRWAVEKSGNVIKAVWIDLGRMNGECLRIAAMTRDDRAQFSIVSWKKCPFRFNRNRNQLELPSPEISNVSMRWEDHFNIEYSEIDLILGFIVGCFNPFGALPILTLVGPEGSAKTTTVKRIRDLIDPSATGIRPKPNLRDLPTACSNSPILCFDNVSHLSKEESDMYCQLSSGTTFSERTLYTNFGESYVRARVPIILNGIASIGDRQDFLSRVIVVSAPSLGKNKKSESDLDEKWQKEKECFFGEIVERLSRALRDYSSVNIETSFRLVDHIRWVTASEILNEKGKYQKLLEYQQNCEKAEALENNPVFRAISKIVESREIIASASEIFELLLNDPNFAKSSFKNASAVTIGRELSRMRQQCIELGWVFEQERNASRRIWRIAKPSSATEIVPGN